MDGLARCHGFALPLARPDSYAQHARAGTSARSHLIIPAGARPTCDGPLAFSNIFDPESRSRIPNLPGRRSIPALTQFLIILSKCPPAGETISYALDADAPWQSALSANVHKVANGSGSINIEFKYMKRRGGYLQSAAIRPKRALIWSAVIKR